MFFVGPQPPQIDPEVIDQHELAAFAPPRAARVAMFSAEAVAFPPTRELSSTNCQTWLL